MDDPNLLSLIQAGQWIPLSALVIGFIVRALKEDTKFLPTVTPERRRILAFGLGLVAGALQLVAGGAPLREAILTAVVSPLFAMLGHHTVIDWMRGGREIPIPWMMKPKPPTSLVALLFLLGCGGSDRQACYARAEASALASAASECPGAWEDCSERPAILDRLQVAQEACP